MLAALWEIAPVHAVRGNVDDDDGELRNAVDLQLDGIHIHLSHGHELGSPTPAALAARYQADVIVFGHTHRPLITHVGPTLVVNPGAAGAARFNLKPSVGLLTLPAREVRIAMLLILSTSGAPLDLWLRGRRHRVRIAYPDRTFRRSETKMASGSSLNLSTGGFRLQPEGCVRRTNLLDSRQRSG